MTSRKLLNSERSEIASGNPERKWQRRHADATPHAAAKLIWGVAGGLTKAQAEASQAFIANLGTDLGNGQAADGEKASRLFHPQPNHEIVWRLSKDVLKDAEKVKFGEAGFPCRVVQQNRAISGGCKKITRAAEPDKEVVINEAGRDPTPDHICQYRACLRSG